MNKGQGFAISAFLAAALLLRQAGPGVAPPTSPPETGKNSTVASEPAMRDREGPWIASCNYWAAARLAEPQVARGPAEVHASLDSNGEEIQLRARLNESDGDRESGCGNGETGRWGFPATVSPHVMALIATIPDPVHTHLSLSFDRTIDALLQAASDNDYLGSYYWLPWKNRGGGLKFTESQDDVEPGHGPERERQPGLIILKPGTRVNPPDSYAKVIYLFLVSETPTQGVDGFQLQNAFLYEAQLRAILAARGQEFTAGREEVVSIIGPQFSGSAASLRAGIDAMRHLPAFGNTSFEITGTTTTTEPIRQLQFRNPRTRFLSLAPNRNYDIDVLRQALGMSGYSAERVAMLVEDDTAAGSAATDFESQKKSSFQVIRFPREISMLRNAQVAMSQPGNGAAPAFSPYLHFSLKDYSAQDSVPQFSRENTPVSQEAQLMTIARQLHQFRAQFIVIVASNVLDQIFLAQFLHRACADARLVFLGADLLMVREIDNVPFIGSITVTPYSLIGLRSSKRAHPDSMSEAYYNAVSYTLWRDHLYTDKTNQPRFQGYRNLFNPADIFHPTVWATAIGRDGYYPLGVLSASADAGDNPHVPPAREVKPQVSRKAMKGLLAQATVYPSLLWAAVCVGVGLLCLLHTVMLWIADYWSPLSRDLAVRDNDQPWRRSAYIHLATGMLFSMAFVVAFPVLWLSVQVHVGFAGEGATIGVMVCAAAALITAFWKTRGYVGWSRSFDGHSRVYPLLNLMAWGALIAICGLWAYLCTTGSFKDYVPDGRLYLVGLCFAFRCVHPASGVSPVPPVLLLLLGWYVWSICQTLRLRFSEIGRPRLPRRLAEEPEIPMFVADDDLEQCEVPRHNCLFKNITCLLITRQLIHRFFSACLAAQKRPRYVRLIDLVLAVVYVALLVRLSLFSPMHSLDHFLWPVGGHLAAPFEILVGGLFFPLLAVSVAGCMRMILIWGSLRRGLLERLENMPIRRAFSRLQVMGWITMLRYGGVEEQWRDVARSLESMRQIVNQDDIRTSLPRSDWQRLSTANARLMSEIREHRRPTLEQAKGIQTEVRDYNFMKSIEVKLAAFGQDLLANVLIPHWKYERSGLVESDEALDDPYRSGQPRMRTLPATESARVLAAEEFVAIRYISLIRAVLANLRYLMIFVSVSFVLAILAWNSYPFQPRQLVDWCFTGLLAVLGSGVIWVFAQMHRNAILSRITDTKANELGWDFYLRVISFGALPVVTWMASQFPDVADFVSKFIQPGVPVIK